MLILIPVDSDNGQNAKISNQFELKKWALINFDAGEIQSIKFFDDRTQTGEDWIDCIIFENKFESYIDFMNEGMLCLVIRKEETIEEIISAFKFKELDEMGL